MGELEGKVITPYVVLARKWRPAQFADIVGQSHIVRTLVNAIRSERIHQAYLFTGSRGIGKTSIARIFAKVIRCESVAPDGQAGELLRSCDACSSCREIALGSSVDVIEIDGASNNGVEAVREIRENAKYLPSNGARKIYIIDEVHMLTTAAFNALLKTLEEPPAHVIFIFATTEPHKIPATILSRCQRFDYRRVTLAQMQTRLAQVAQAEGIQAETGSLALIARAAEGSMRDALSLLDQVIAFSGEHLSSQAVRESVGLIESQTVLGILKGILKREPLVALEQVEQAYQRGHDLRVLTRTLTEYLHGAILSKVGAPNSGALELSEEEWKELAELSRSRTLEEIELIFQVLHHGMEWVARSPQPKIILDVLLVKCAAGDGLAYADPNLAPPSPGPVATPNPSPIRSMAPTATRPVESSAPRSPSIAPVTPPAAVIAAPVAAVPVAAVTSAPAAPVATSGPITWEGFIDTVRKRRPLLASILEHGTCVDLPGDSLSICFGVDASYYKEQLQARAYHEQLVTLAREYFGKTIPVQIELRSSGESPAARKEREAQHKADTAREAARNHPIILEAKSLFGGELGPIELTEYANGQ